MLKVLSPDEVIESRENLLDELDDALLGREDEWQNGFPGNFELYNMIRHILEFWKRAGR